MFIIHNRPTHAFTYNVTMLSTPESTGVSIIRWILFWEVGDTTG